MLNKQVVEAFRRESYKYAGRQKIVMHAKWGFTSFTVAEYQELETQNLYRDCGAQVKVITIKGTAG